VQESEYKGQWWLPDRPRRKAVGTLRLSGHGSAVLDLVGSFTGNTSFSEPPERDIILGSCGGKAITLHRCILTKARETIGAVQSQPVYQFFATEAYIGVQFRSGADIKFGSVSVVYSNIDEWLNLHVFDIQHEQDRTIITYEEPRPIEIDVTDVGKVSIISGRVGPTMSYVQTEATIKQKTFVKVEPAKEIPYEDYVPTMYHIRNLLSLGVGQPVHPTEIMGTTKKTKQLIRDKPYYPSVQIISTRWSMGEVPESLFPYRMRFTFSDVSDRMQLFLNTWFKKAELLDPVYDLYFGILYNQHMFLEQRFLSLIQAIESYHRRFMKNCELSEEEHKTRVAEILGAVAEKHREWLEKDILPYSNEPSLRRRLKDVLAKCSAIVSLNKGDQRNFVNRVVTTRNYLTHYDASLRAGAARGVDLLQLTQRLKVLVETCLLLELGFEASEVDKLFARGAR